ncbi:MAG: hypothetical protein IJP62_06690 [Treponema sp.]|nr:hypothetical protein [Treponema sp.]
MSEANEFREMSRRLVEIATTVPEMPDKLISDMHALIHKLELAADELEDKKTSLVVARQKGYVNE